MLCLWVRIRWTHRQQQQQQQPGRPAKVPHVNKNKQCSGNLVTITCADSIEGYIVTALLKTDVGKHIVVEPYIIRLS
jgi:hypothetical protein